MPPTLLVITGPTAIGKTAAAIELALHLGTEIISADSRQFFREMNIGTAKPGPDELAAAPHHFINNLKITDPYDAGKYESEALQLISGLFKKHEVVILCGGSGMYIDAICKGFDPLPDVSPQYREQLNELFLTGGITALQTLLKKHDPEHYRVVDLQNPHRLIRALEICLATGVTYSSLRKGNPAKRNFRIIKAGLTAEKTLLNDRIDRRVDRMMEEGLADEAESLYPYRHLNALQTVGYRELFECMEGISNIETAVSNIKQNTRRFAKRQMTWFRKHQDITWLDATNCHLKNSILDLLNPVK